MSDNTYTFAQAVSAEFDPGSCPLCMRTDTDVAWIDVSSHDNHPSWGVWMRGTYGF